MTLREDTRRLVALLGLSAAWLLLSCAPALAHARLLEAFPSSGAALAEPPEQVRLAFSEPVEAAFDPIEVYDRRGERVDLGNARVDPDDAEVLVVGLEDGLPEGSYSVEWRVTSLDGHVIDGAYRFAVGDSKAAEAGAGGAGNPEERAAEGQGESPVGGVGWPVPVAVLVAITVVIVGFAALRRR